MLEKLITSMPYIKDTIGVLSVVTGLLVVLKKNDYLGFFRSRYSTAKKILEDKKIKRSPWIIEAAKEVMELEEFKRLYGVRLYNSICIPAIMKFKEKLGKDFTTKQVALVNHLLVYDKKNVVAGIRPLRTSDYIERYMWLFQMYSVLAIGLLSTLYLFLVNHFANTNNYFVPAAFFVFYASVSILVSDIYIIYTAPIPIAKRIMARMKNFRVINDKP